MMKRVLKLLLITIFIVSIFLFYYFDLHQKFTLSYIQENYDLIRGYVLNDFWTVSILFFFLYVLVTAFSFPGAAVLTLVAGAIFGLANGTIIVSFASTIGATFAFLISRFLLRDTMINKFEKEFKKVDDGFKKDGPFYLFSLRLIPIFPFFIINIVMGLTNIRVRTFFWVSQLGMLPGTLAYVNAGKELGKIDSLKSILSPTLILSFTILGLLPIIAKKIMEFASARKVFKDYKRPKKYDYNLVVIGGGAAGLVSSYIAAVTKAKVALIERHKMGGDCLNTGCVPSKAIIRASKVAHSIKTSEKYGIYSKDLKVDFEKVLNKVKSVITKIEPHDSVDRYTNLGVECLEGQAKIISPWEVSINGKIISTKNIIIASGASPFVIPFSGLDNVDYVTSDDLWSMKELPKKFVIVGGGPIGSELAQAFSRLGSDVTILEKAPVIMNKDDLDVSEFVKNKFNTEGISVETKVDIERFEKRDDKNIVIYKKDDEVIELEFDKVLIALGRKANIDNMGIDDLGIKLRNNGTVEADQYLRTNYPNIFVCGDVTGPFQLTHAAAHQAWYASVNSLFGTFKKFKADYSSIPWCTYTDPEVASVGLNEMMAKQKGIKYEVTKYGIDDLDRAIADGSDEGFVKVLTVPGKDKILGATIVGSSAGDIIIEFISAIKNNIGLNKVLSTIHIYPTMSEANKYAAGMWKQKRVSSKTLKILEKFHSWRRS